MYKNPLNSIRSFVTKKKKPVLISSFLVLVFVLSVTVSYFVFEKLGEPMEPPEEVKPITQDPLTPVDLENTYNLLLLGYGGPGHDGSYLTDVIKIVAISPEDELVRIVSVPRDLWVELPIRSDKKDYFKINAAYAISMDDRGYPLKEPKYKGRKGAALMIKEAVGKVCGLNIDNYLAIDFSGFKEVVDILDGIEVNVPVTFDDNFYPVKGLENEICGKSPEEIEELHQKYSGFQLEKQFECRYEKLHFEKGLQEMDGETVLKFVRSRHSDTHGGDFARAQRQFEVLMAIKRKALSLNALDNTPRFASKFAGTLTTDVDVDYVADYVKKYPEIKNYKIETVHLTTDNVLTESKSSDGQYILISKEGIGRWEEIHSYIAGEDKD